MDIEKTAELLRNWYKRSDVKFQLIKYTFNREFALLVPSFIGDIKDVNSFGELLYKKYSIRMLKCHNVQHLDYILDRGIRMFEKKIPFNFYYSLARYNNGIPNQTFNLALRYNEEWAKMHFKEMIAYDFLIDVDSGTHEDIDFAHDTTKKIIDYLNELNVPYELRFSGMGFHIVIPYIYFKGDLSFNPQEENIYQLYSRIAKMLKSKFSDMLDTGIYDSRRVCKIPYSLALYEDNIYMCSPINYREVFDNFFLCDYEINESNISEREVSREDRKVYNLQGNINSLLSELGRFEENVKKA